MTAKPPPRITAKEQLRVLESLMENRSAFLLRLAQQRKISNSKARREIAVLGSLVAGLRRTVEAEEQEQARAAAPQRSLSL